MMFKKARYAVTIGAVLAVVSGSVVSTAFAATASATTNTGSAQAIYAFNENSVRVLPGATVAWDAVLFGLPSTTPDVSATFPGSTDSDGVAQFISNVGDELSPSKWLAVGGGGYTPGTKNVLQPSLSPSDLSNPGTSTASAIKAAGGNFSIGFAFTKNNGLTVATGGAVFHPIHITAVTGAFTFIDSETAVVTPPPVVSGSFDQNLSVTTAQAVDGALNLISPANTTTTFGAAVLDPITKLSTSTATLADFTVQDDRVVSHPGWTLTSTVADFVSGASTIPKKQLGIAPFVKSGPTNSLIVAAAAQVAGSANYSPGAAFASADSSSVVGTTVLNAALTFVAPVTAPAGTYTSKLTITLASK